MQSTLRVASDLATTDSLVVCNEGSRAGMKSKIAKSGNSGCFRKRQRVDSSSNDDCVSSKKPCNLAPSTRYPESILTDTTWSRLHKMLIAAKSLQNITRVTLAFFKEHKTAQLNRPGVQDPSHPIPVPLTEVYSMIAPRKRRVYDVIHVLEGVCHPMAMCTKQPRRLPHLVSVQIGVGVLKRDHRKTNSRISRFRAGHFIYYGKAGAMERLGAIRTRACEIASDAQLMYPDLSRDKLDMVLLNACNIQAQIECWPHLATTTVAFLSLLLSSDDGGTTSLGAISRRIFEAGVVCEGDSQGEVEINRRVYDLVSVLASLNIVVLSHLSDSQKKESSRRQGYATPRKGVRFNTAIFKNADLLRIGESSSSHLETIFSRENVGSKPHGGAATTESRLVKSPSCHSQTMSDDSFDAVMLPSFVGEESNHALEDLFPDISPTEDTGSMVDWWNVALRGLLLRDALPLEDCLDWEIIQAISRARQQRADGSKAATVEEPQDEHDVDMTCHEEIQPDCAV